jgi:peptidoglycan/LPS O-acetylase OafA/YrhL
MTTINNRRYDIDWIRVIAIGLLLIYHIAIGFQPWGLFIGFIQNGDSLPSIWLPMSMLNVWRIPLLFFVSGMGVYFALRKRNWKQLIIERARRILIPFLFGILVIVPIHIIILMHNFGQPIFYSPNSGHLWFLGNIFVYTLLLSPLFFYLKENEDGKFGTLVRKLFQGPLGFLIIIAGLIAEVIIVKPVTYELYAQTWHGFFLGLTAFLFGFCCVYSGKAFWDFILKWRFGLLIVSIILYAVRLMYFDLKSPDYLLATETCFWVFSVFAFGYKYLNKPSKYLTYLSEAAYPVYILHMIFLYLGSYLIFPLNVAAELKFVMVIVFTMIGCFACYEMIKRISFLRPFFGLKKQSNHIPTI